MKTAYVTFAMMIFAGSASAASDNDVYHAWAMGNPDLSSDFHQLRAPAASQPGIGDNPMGQTHGINSSAEIYRGFEKGNPDL